MSFDIDVYSPGVFATLVPVTEWDCEQFRAGLEGRAADPAPDPRIGEFFRDLLARFPELESFSDDDRAEVEQRSDIVWSITPEAGPDHVELAVMWSRGPAVLNVVRDLTARHGLVCYDPQSAQVYNPPFPQ